MVGRSKQRIQNKRKQVGFSQSYRRYQHQNTPKRPKLLLEGGKKGFKREKMATGGDNSKNKLCQN